MPEIIVKPSIVDLRDTKVSFFDEGDLAGFTIGNSTLRMTYEDALRFSQMLRVHAKRAKRRVGDASRHWSAVGILEGIRE
jgi:hypothetical protein